MTRPNSLRLTLHVLKSAITDLNPWIFTDGTLYKFGLDCMNVELLVIVILIFGGINILQQRCSIREKIAEQNLVFRWGIYFVAIFSILVFGIYGSGYDAAAFVYMAY